MGVALVIMILVGAGEGADVSTRAVQPALEQAARRPVTVSLREVPRVPDEAEAAWVAVDANVDVVVEVGWSGPAHTHALVHLHGRDGRVLRASDLEFAAAEPKAERGRAVGFAVATMLADEPVAAGILASTAAAEASVAAAAFALEPMLRPSTTPPPTTPSASTSGRSGAADRGAPAAAEHPRFAVEAAGSAVADVGASASGVGPLARLQWNVTRDLGLRAGGAARWFTVGGHGASELAGTAGILWTFARGGAFAAGLRGEVGVAHDTFTEEVIGTNPKGMVLLARSIERRRLAPTFLAGIEGDWRPGRTTALFLALNLEASTRTLVAEAASTPSAVWSSIEGGIRFSF